MRGIGLRDPTQDRTCDAFVTPRPTRIVGAKPRRAECLWLIVSVCLMWGRVGLGYSGDDIQDRAGTALAAASCGSVAEAGRGVSCVIVSVLCVYARL